MPSLLIVDWRLVARSNIQAAQLSTGQAPEEAELIDRLVVEGATLENELRFAGGSTFLQSEILNGAIRRRRRHTAALESCPTEV